MQNYLKFSYKLIYYLIRNNISKSIFLLISIISFHYAGSFKLQTDTYKIAHQVKIRNTYVYIYERQDEFKLLTLDKEGAIKNGILTNESYNNLNILFWIIFSISILFLMVCKLSSSGSSGDDSCSWEFKRSYDEAFSTLIYCEEENDKFYYFAMGKLVGVTDRLINQSYYTISHELGVDNFEKLKRCPNYMTKKNKRESILDSILP